MKKFLNQFTLINLSAIVFITGVGLAKSNILILLSFFTVFITIRAILLKIKFFLCILTIIISTTILLVSNSYIQNYEEKLDVKFEKIGNREIMIEGVITSIPVRSGKGIKFDFKVTSIETEENAQTYNSKILVRSPRYPEYLIGSHLKIRGTIKKPVNFNDQFDYVGYMKASGYSGILENPIEIKDIQESNNSIIYKLGRLKTKFISDVKKALPEPHASLLSGMLFGSKESFDEEFYESLQIAGVTHIIAVSGYNVSLVVGIFERFAGFLDKRKLQFMTMFGVSFFILFIGIGNIPALRAGIMCVTFLLPKMWGRKVSSLNVFLICIGLMMLQNPLVFKLVSFQLSISALIGIYIFAPQLQKKCTFLPEIIRSDFATSLAATLATSPIILTNFDSISLIGILINILVLPVAGLIMKLGFLYIFIYQISALISLLPGIFVYILLEYFIQTVNWAVNFDFLYLNPLENKLIIIAAVAVFVVLSYKHIHAKVKENYSKT